MIALPYWIADTLVATPAFLWIFFGLGVPWALTLLPRANWGRRIEVIALAIPVGAALLTAWMFVLGTLATPERPLLRLDLILGGTIVIAALGIGLAWIKARREPRPAGQPMLPLRLDERLLIGLIALALVVRWVVIAYWPFTIYDALWVYGYQGRLYSLLGHIPDTIGYYPQFMSLQYTYGQIVYGGINDHAARAGLIILHAGAILAAYVLGRRLFDRRVGLYAAAVWGLYPHLGDWARGGDLEIALAQMFTLAAAYFLPVWLEPHAPSRRADALIAGVLLGIGMWTKPTMGAFIWGVVLLLALAAVRARLNWRVLRPRLEVVLITGLACIPLGAIWYARNLLLGHAAIDFPPDFWLTQAARSGVEFGWLILLGLLLLAFVYLRPGGWRPDPRLAVLATGACALALLPTMMMPRRMTAVEYAALFTGAGIIAWIVREYFRHYADAQARRAITALAGGLALAAPYFITWFWSYSYHFRLSFAIVPLLALPSAYIIARWTASWRRVGQGVWAAALIVLALPGVISTIYDTYMGWDYLFTDVMPDDHARYTSGNPALMNVVDGLQIWIDEHPGETLRVSAPGNDRLPFFFPLHDIDVDSVPTRLDAIADSVYFIYGVPESAGRYATVPPLTNQVMSSLGRTDILRRAWGLDDGIFRYDVYELHLANRFVPPAPNGPAGRDILFGDWARYLGYDIGGLDLWPGRRVIFHTFWEVLRPPDRDWTLYVHLLDQRGELLANWDGPVNPTRDGYYYSTLLWEPGEFVIDERIIELPLETPPPGSGYRLVVGFYDLRTGERVPVIVDGIVSADGWVVDDRIAVVAQAPG
ncbi:MAG: glycosyltransferase family 39 protein [Anaerolinea sp.]|nr:glycosyltransferase family 39 protein [Anaerolinea sp.]